MQSLLNNYGWGVDACGRAHICKNNSNKVVFCAMPNQSALTAIWELIDRNYLEIPNHSEVKNENT